MPPPAADPADPADRAGPDELPRRVRQASLAPQLRETPARPAPAVRRTEADRTGRNPEEARAAMSAYQQGWARGKSRGPLPVSPDRPSPRGETR